MPLIFPYIKRAELSGFYSYHEIVQNIPTIKSYFFSNPGTLFWLKLEHIADEYTSFGITVSFQEAWLVFQF